MSAQPLRGQTALVTGASSGIGEGMARTLGAAGATVAVNYAGNAAGAARVVADLQAAGARVLAVRADVAREADVEVMFARAAGKVIFVSDYVHGQTIGVDGGMTLSPEFARGG